MNALNSAGLLATQFGAWLSGLRWSGVVLVVGLWWSAVAARGSSGEDWPQLLGPRANGTSVETGLLDRWPTNGPRLLWEAKTGAGYGAPSVRGDLLVLHHRLGGEEVVECLQAASGRPRWRYGYPSRFADPYGYNNGPRSTPLLTADRCYCFGAEGKLTCLELKTGKLVWQRDTAADWNVPPAFFGVGSSPVLEGGLLLVMVGGQPNSGLVAFDAANGKTVWESVGEKNWQGQPMRGWQGEPAVKWETSEKQASYSTPVAATIHGQRQVLCLMRQGLVSVNPTNGSVNFSFWFRSPVTDSVNAMDPVVVDDLILLSAAYYKIGSVLLRVKPGGRSVEEVWRSPVLEAHWTTPIYRDGFVYAFSGRNESDARFRCVELRTGKLMWDRDERWAAHSTRTPSVYGRGSCILADGKLIVLGEGGLLGLFRPNPQRAEEISRFQVPQLHHPCWAAPVLSRKRLFLRGEDRLVCLDLARP
ncbi:MAG: PQQ-binding-like beta-propeller repeat protein [Verrucomicrobia bacterium]|nr:PQQ-binding-like beta-propeller repeat protein [Verrucomicrobiota bacterium]